ncbi:MAG: fused ferrous iron transport protein A/B [Elusimicrobiota bacterium]
MNEFNCLDTTDLLSMEAGEAGEVHGSGGGPEVEAKLNAMGIAPGLRVSKISARTASGPVRVSAAGAELAIGRSLAKAIQVKVRSSVLLLAGNPNVGKSVVFSRLTGLDVVSANYPGTTVEFMSAGARLSGERYMVIDVPGTYSLKPANKAEEVAASLLAEHPSSLIINVVDATNLERNLFFTTELMAAGREFIILLNKSDIARRSGIDIDHAALGKALGVKVIPFVATTGEGAKELERAMTSCFMSGLPPKTQVPSDPGERWKFIGLLAQSVQKISHRHPGFLEKLAELTANPSTGIPFAAVALSAAFWLVRTAGEGMINLILDPLFNNYYLPVAVKAAHALTVSPFALHVLLGSTPEPMSSFGLLTTGPYIPVVVVMPYIIAFYLVLGLLEDIGYLPRLAVLMDGLMHRLGLHGYGVIPLMLGLGCKVPAVLAARVLENRRERVIATALTLSIAPCMPQTAMIFSILARFPIGYTLAAFGTIAVSGIAGGLILAKLMKGEAPELFLEIPPYQLPAPRMVFMKLWLRLREFLYEAVPMIFLGVLVVGLADAAGLLNLLSRLAAPVMETVFGLPGSTAPVITLGFLRKDISITLLAPLGLGPAQLAVASVFLALYLPCLAACLVTLRELGTIDSLKVIAVNFVLASIAAATLNLLLTII